MDRIDAARVKKKMRELMEESEYLSRFCGRVVYVDQGENIVVQTEARKFIYAESILEYIDARAEKAVAPTLECCLVI